MQTGTLFGREAQNKGAKRKNSSSRNFSNSLWSC